MAATMLIGLVIVFILKRKDSKPMFVKVIWALLSLAELAEIGGIIVLRFMISGGPLDLYRYYTYMGIFTSVLVSVAHWIFATQYLEVVLLLPLLLENAQADIKKKQHQVRWIIYTANAIFYVMVATWACFMFSKPQ